MIMTTKLKFNGKTYSAKLVAILFVEVEYDVYNLYVDVAQHIALLVNKDYKVINTKHLESWQQDALVEEDKTDEEMAKADEVIDSLRKEWEI